MKRYSSRFAVFAGVLGLGVCATAQNGAMSKILQSPAPGGDASTERVVLNGGGETIVLEPYAPNILRVTLSTEPAAAEAGPGVGVIAKPDPAGWVASQSDGEDVFRSGRMIAVVRHPHGAPPESPWGTTGTAKFFRGSAPWADISFWTPEGKKILEMEGWDQAVYNHKDGTADLALDFRPSDAKSFTVGASFDSPDDEHYYGLGQNQEGYLDHRGHVVHCAHDYDAPAAPSVCVPFMVSSRGYGLLWDNPAKTTISAGFNEQTRWSSEAGNRVSYFVIYGNSADEIYAGYKLLTGPTHMLPKAAYGYVQCKQRYSSQAEVLAVAKGYRERHLPADVLVVDWFYYTRMGQFDFDPKYWPDPKAMNKQLHDMGFETMISVWPRFTPDDRYFDFIQKNGWFEHLADGTPVNGLPYDRAGSDIDTTNPDAAKWYWNLVKDNILSQGFDSLWADETEPDLPPNGAFLHIGPGTEYFNVYPYFHTKALYDGFRADEKDRRALILSRDAYLGAQSNGTIFWSSDIFPTWDAYRRQIPTGLDFAASGLTYWTNDTGGWQYLPQVHHPAHKPLLDPSDARAEVGHYDDYPELYTRWFQYATFLPIMRTHGSRPENEVWSYGKQAEPILEKYLRLRYALMPYIYSLGYHTWKTGAPFLRALPLDFPNDPNVAELTDEYMFGPAFLVAPVTEQGATSRKVYLPAGADWYNYWTNERFKGGQTIDVPAPIDTIPLFVRAGSIIPFGSVVESTHDKQTIVKVRVYPGANGEFTMFNDDGTTYAYENGAGQITHLHWDDAAGKLTHEGAAAWSGPDSSVVEIMGK